MARSAYKAKLSLSYVLDGTSTAISDKLVKYVMIEDSFGSKYMPVIYISLSVNNDMYNSLIKNEKTAKIYLNIQKYNAYSDTSISKNDIKGQFTYITPTSNPNYSEELVSGSESADVAYRTITLALMSMDLLNKSKSSFNGVFGNIDQDTLVYKIMEGVKSVIKQPTYNPEYETILIPPVNSRLKLIQYLYNKCPFYDTNYVFFMDFSRSYLLDLSGEPLPAEGDEIDTVYIDIQAVTSDASYYEGIEVRNNAYYMHVNPANTNVTVNKGTDKISNELVFINDSGTVDAVDLNINNNYDSDVKQSFRRGGNAVLYKNIAESNTVVIEVVKENIDGSIFTPNKAYMVNNYKDYADYNGNYTLLYKKEVLKNVNGQFGLSVCLGLRKVGNITVIGTHVATTATNNSRSATYRYSTTAKTTTTSSTTKTTTTLSASKSKAIPSVTRLKASAGQTLQRPIMHITEES